MISEFKNQDALHYLQSLEPKCVNFVLTDPPYAISRASGFSSGDAKGKDTDRFRVSYDFGEWDTVDLDYFNEVFTETYRVMVNGATMVVFYDQWKLQELKDLLECIGFKMFRMIEWVKTNPVPINSKSIYLSNAKEYAIVCVKGGRPTFNATYHKGVFEYPIYHAKDRWHTTQKSLPLFEELVRLHTDEGDVVLDMFSGSATTQVAAIRQYRLYAGCEKNAEFFNKCKMRIEENEKIYC